MINYQQNHINYDSGFINHNIINIIFIFKIMHSDGPETSTVLSSTSNKIIEQIEKHDAWPTAASVRKKITYNTWNTKIWKWTDKSTFFSLTPPSMTMSDRGRSPLTQAQSCITPTWERCVVWRSGGWGGLGFIGRGIPPEGERQITTGSVGIPISHTPPQGRKKWLQGTTKLEAAPTAPTTKSSLECPKSCGSSAHCNTCHPLNWQQKHSVKGLSLRQAMGAPSPECLTLQKEPASKQQPPRHRWDISIWANLQHYTQRSSQGVQTTPGQEGTPDPEALDPILPRKRQPPSRGPAPVTKRYGFLLNVFFRPADSFKRTAMKLCIILFSNKFFNCHFRWRSLHLCLAYDCVCTSCPIEVTGSFCIFL